MILLRVLSILVFVFLVLVPLPALAVDPPSLLQVSSVAVYRHLLVSNDRLYVLRYNIGYTAPPTELATDLFLVRLFDGGAELGSVRPYAYSNRGFGYGVAALYFPSWASDWQKELCLRLEGSPTVFETPLPLVTYTVVAGDYVSGINQAEYRQKFGQWVIQQALFLTHPWNLALTTETQGGTVLTALGEAYFPYAIPGLQGMAPGIFFSTMEVPSYTARTWTKSLETTAASRMSGSSINQGLQAAADTFGVNLDFVTMIVTVMAYLAIAVLAAVKLQNATVGLLVGMPILLGGTVIGWFPMALMFLIIFLVLFMLGYILFFRSA